MNIMALNTQFHIPAIYLNTLFSFIMQAPKRNVNSCKKQLYARKFFFRTFHPPVCSAHPCQFSSQRITLFMRYIPGMVRRTVHRWVARPVTAGVTALPTGCPSHQHLSWSRMSASRFPGPRLFLLIDIPERWVLGICILGFLILGWFLNPTDV